MILLLPIVSLFFLLPVVGIVLGIMTAVDVGKYPDWAFGQTGASKTVWQILPILLGFFCLGIGGIVMYTMWVSSKRQVVAHVAQTGTPPPYGYGAQPPPPGWSGPPPAPTWSPPPGSAPPGYTPPGPVPSPPYPPAQDRLPPPPAVEPPQ